MPLLQLRANAGAKRRQLRFCEGDCALAGPVADAQYKIHHTSTIVDLAYQDGVVLSITQAQHNPLHRAVGVLQHET